MTNVPDLTGQRFGWLTVIKRAGSDKASRALWFCRCGCGGEHTVPTYLLKNSMVTSCGCKKRQSYVKLRKFKTFSTGTNSGTGWVHSDDIPEGW